MRISRLCAIARKAARRLEGWSRPISRRCLHRRERPAKAFTDLGEALIRGFWTLSAEEPKSSSLA